MSTAVGNAQFLRHQTEPLYGVGTGDRYEILQWKGTATADLYPDRGSRGRMIDR